MTRLIGGLLVVLALVSLPLAAGAEQGGAKPKVITVEGTVSAVAIDSLTVKGKTDSWTFTIDKTTEVRAKGATTKGLELQAAGKAKKLTEFVKVGDGVTINYHDLGATKHAALIRVTEPAK